MGRQTNPLNEFNTRNAVSHLSLALSLFVFTFPRLFLLCIPMHLSRSGMESKQNSYTPFT
jgi:hypothetical protein